MSSFDAIVIGSGPAGVFAARELRGTRTLILDAGNEAGVSPIPPGNIYDVRSSSSDLFDGLIGTRFEALHNLEHRYLSPKLKAPQMRFITRVPQGENLQFDSDHFEAVVSYARGGLANAWGAGVFRFNNRDLDGFPIRAEELDPFYDELTEHIGISGTEDDLAGFMGPAKGLQPPYRLSTISSDFLQRYSARRDFFHRRHIHLGRMRAAMLSQDHRGRPSHDANNREFFEPNIRSIYHPGYTLDELLRENAVEYLPNRLALRYAESEEGVTVTARNLSTRDVESHRARKLLIGAGALNTARLVLASNDDYESRLPVLDNLVSYIPFVNPRRLGQRLDTHSFSGAELIAVYDGPLSAQPLQATFYGLVAPMRADLVFEFPLSIRGNLLALRHLIPAIGMLQLFYPDDASHGNYLKLERDGSASIHYEMRRGGAVERELIAAFRRIGYLSHSRLVKSMNPGSSMHYAGALPMAEQPRGRYETDRNGKLFGSRHVYIVDAANFSALPAKNLTFTIMANSMRIAAKVKREIS
jgi:choline dehydrogenase-like flavoprotein